MGKIKMKTSGTIAEHYNSYLLSRQASGLSEKTLTTYRQHFNAISRHIAVDGLIDKLTSDMLDMMIVHMQGSGLSPNSINSYTRTLRAFLSWCNVERLTNLNIKLYKGEETIKETYTDTELAVLLKKPDVKKCKFSEYRNWVIINFLLNSGSRAATLRNIQNKDVDLDSHMVYYRHNKGKKIQAIPLCGLMCGILREYMSYRGGESADYLFPTDTGEKLTENGLRCSIARYNERRGVQKTSIHLFRHTFARKYLIDCGGDAFTLQRLLGHSTLEMTKHYCTIFDADITKNYDNLSPLAQIKGASTKIKMER